MAALSDLWLQTSEGTVFARVSAHTPDRRRPIVILVHGMVISSRYMVPTAERLAPFANVYAVDLPGYGKSYKP